MYWQNNRAHLDVRKLFHPAALGGRRYVSFIADDFEVSVRHDVVVEVRKVLRVFLDLVAYVDGKGLHFAWRGGRGRLNLCSRTLTAVERTDAFVLALPGPPTRRLSNPPTLVGDILEELGFC